MQCRAREVTTYFPSRLPDLNAPAGLLEILLTLATCFRTCNTISPWDTMRSWTGFHTSIPYFLSLSAHIANTMHVLTHAVVCIWGFLHVGTPSFFRSCVRRSVFLDRVLVECQWSCIGQSFVQDSCCCAFGGLSTVLLFENDGIPSILLLLSVRFYVARCWFLIQGLLVQGFCHVCACRRLFIFCRCKKFSFVLSKVEAMCSRTLGGHMFEVSFIPSVSLGGFCLYLLSFALLRLPEQASC